jgi:ribosomal protein S18 acetylase RimI-like enzyme
MRLMTRRTPVELRPIGPTDRDELLESARRYWRELMPSWRGNDDPAHQATYFAHRFRLDDPASLAWWAVVDDQRIGFAKVDLLDDVEGRWAQVRDFFVEPDYRRRGYGRGFAEAIVAALSAQAIARVDLNVRVDNPRALAFWRRCGFELTLYRLRRFVERPADAS